MLIVIIKNSRNYLDLYNSSFHVKAKITKHDGTKLGADDLVAPTNLFFYAWISDIETEINSTNVTSPYVGYLTALL